MTSTAGFTKARPDLKRQLILEGIANISAQFNELSVTAKKLNAWLDYMDIDQADAKTVQQFRKLTSDCQFNADALTEQILINSQKIRHINDHVSKQLIQNLQTP